MRKFFVELNGFNAIALVDDMNKALMIDETDIHEEITLESAKNMDLSNISMDGTADEARCDLGFGTVVFFSGIKDSETKATEI